MDPDQLVSVPVVALFRLLGPILILPIAFLLNVPFGRSPYVRDGVHQQVREKVATAQWSTPNLWLDRAQRKDPLQDNNHATVEFLENGELADDCSPMRVQKTPCQLQHAVQLLSAAKAITPTGDTLNVIVYVHGNENYAGEDSDNYPHFRQTINCLNLGTDSYRVKYAAALKNRKHGELDCLRDDGADAVPAVGNDPPEPERPSQNVPASLHQHYIGIYLGWRGNWNNTPANVREKTARKVATSPQSRFVETLYTLRDTAKATQARVSATSIDATQVRFIVIGHSFGGLIVEQSAGIIYKGAYGSAQQESVTMSCPTGSAAAEGVRPFADMMITIAAAEHARAAKKIIETFLQPGHTFCGDPAIAPSLFRPVIVSFVAKRDFWSYGAGSEARHYLGGEIGDGKPADDIISAGKDVYETLPGPHDVQWATPAVVSYFQNTCFLRRPFSSRSEDFEGEPVCDFERKHKLQVKQGHAFPILPTNSPLSSLYVRFTCVDPKHPTLGCTTEDPWNHSGDLHIWNRSPYWIAAIDVDTFAGHGPFGYPRFNWLIQDMAGSFEPLPLDHLLPNPFPASSLVSLSKP